VRSPRTVVLRVPLDPCGNPIPAAPVPAAPAPAATSRSAATSPVVPATALEPAEKASPRAETARPAAPSLTPSEAATLKTFGDAAPAPAAQLEGWGPSPLKQVDPATGATSIVAEKPLAPESADPPLRKIESIPAPAPKAPATAEKPLLDFGAPKDPVGPSVSPAPPATDDRPATGTSGQPARPFLPSRDRTT